MAVVEKSVLIEHTAAQMFDLVDAVDQYPQFMPWCGGVDVHEKSLEKTSATLHISYNGIKARFSTANDKTVPQPEIPGVMTIRLSDGPFKQLDGHWRFTSLGETACKVEFRLQYEFSNKLLEKAVGSVFNHIANTFVDSFVKRARQIYG